MDKTKIKLELIKSPIGYDRSQEKTLDALGLRKMHKTVEKKNTPEIRGMIRKVIHLVRIISE